MIRENRLYQADWLMRFYDFKVDEIVTPADPLLDMEIDPKLNWALRNLEIFPLDINKADYRLLIRVPGIGLQSAEKICAARKFNLLPVGAFEKNRHCHQSSKIFYYLLQKTLKGKTGYRTR